MGKFVVGMGYVGCEEGRVDGGCEGDCEGFEDWWVLGCEG